VSPTTMSTMTTTTTTTTVTPVTTTATTTTPPPATTTPANQANYHKLTGDIINVLILASSVLYVLTVVYFTLPGAQGVVDEYWKRDGFCIQNKDVPYWSSFDTCLYVDVIFSAILAIMYFNWKDIPGMESANAIVPAAIVSTLGHGIAHGVMAVEFRNGSDNQRQDDNAESEEIVTPALWMILGYCALFWCPLLKAAMPKMEIRSIVVLAAIATSGNLFVKKELGFAYVQTVVNMSSHISQFMRSYEEKNLREYMMIPLSNVLPTVVAWNEILFCDSYFRSAGGHVLYDASIIISFIVFYLDAYSYNKKQLNSKRPNKEKIM